MVALSCHRRSPFSSEHPFVIMNITLLVIPCVNSVYPRKGNGQGTACSSITPCINLVGRSEKVFGFNFWERYFLTRDNPLILPTCSLIGYLFEAESSEMAFPYARDPARSIIDLDRTTDPRSVHFCKFLMNLARKVASLPRHL